MNAMTLNLAPTFSQAIINMGEFTSVAEHIFGNCLEGGVHFQLRHRFLATMNIYGRHNPHTQQCG